MNYEENFPGLSALSYMDCFIYHFKNSKIRPIDPPLDIMNLNLSAMSLLKPFIITRVIVCMSGF